TGTTGTSMDLTNAVDLVQEFRNAGFMIEADGPDLYVTPFSRLSERQLATLRERKQELLLALSVAPSSTDLPKARTSFYGQPSRPPATAAHRAQGPPPRPKSVLLKPADQVTEEHRTYVREHKTALVAGLTYTKSVEI